jgi:hypothetical protein
MASVGRCIGVRGVDNQTSLPIEWSQNTDGCRRYGAGPLNEVVKAKRFAASGRATAAHQLDCQLVKRSTAAGSSVVTALLPFHMTRLIPRPVLSSRSIPVRTSTLSLGTTVGGTRAQQSNVSAARSGGAATPIEFDIAAPRTSCVAPARGLT